jgi:dienelactone hydrolase
MATLLPIIMGGMKRRMFLGALAGLRAQDLANLYEPLDRAAAENRPRLSFLEGRWKTLEAWKREARPEYLRRLSYDPKPAALAAEVVAREQREGFTVERLRIPGTSFYDIPARALVPAGLRRRAPGVLALHCHSGRYVWGHEKVLSRPGEPPAVTEFRERAYGRPYAEELARRGYVVLVIDAFYFGERRLQVEEIDPETAPGDMREPLRALRKLEAGSAEWMTAVNGLCSRYEHLTAKTIFATGATWPGMLCWDDRRSLDYLLTRPEVDPQRIGALGLSIGGLRTAHLIGAETRIRAACVTGWMTEFRQQLRRHLRSHTWMAYIPGLYGSLDLPDLAALHAPGALLVQQCGRDALYPREGMKAAAEKLERIYARAGIRERFRATFYDVPHAFRPEMQEEAFAWLEKWV